VEETIIHLKGAGSGILTKDPKRRLESFPKRRATRMHQFYNVIARAGPKEWILDSGVSTHMTGIK